MSPCLPGFVKLSLARCAQHPPTAHRHSGMTSSHKRATICIQSGADSFQTSEWQTLRGTGAWHSVTAVTHMYSLCSLSTEIPLSSSNRIKTHEDTGTYRCSYGHTHTHRRPFGCLQLPPFNLPCPSNANKRAFRRLSTAWDEQTVNAAARHKTVVDVGSQWLH